MCTALAGLTTFIYLGSWSVIIYYMVHRNMSHIKHVFIPIVFIICNAIVLLVHLDAECHVNYIKTGAATEAVLLLILFLNVSDCARCTPGDPGAPPTTRRNQQEA